MAHTANNKKSLTLNDLDYFDPEHLILVGDAMIDETHLIGHHLDSANAFYETGVNQIITEGFLIHKKHINTRAHTDEDKAINYIECTVKFTNVKIDPPTSLNCLTGDDEPLFPKNALLYNKNYSGSMYVSFDIEATAYLHNGTPIKRVDHVNNFRIAKLPIIKGSKLCHTYGMPAEALAALGEDPSDSGGYYITKHEYAIDCIENTAFNQLKTYINLGFGKSRVRSDFLSKPGDGWENSDMFIMIFNTDNTFTIEIARNKLMKVQIPFFLLFRALGWSSDKELIDWIVMDYDSDSNKNLLNMVIEAFNAKYGPVNYRAIYNQGDALRAIVNLVPEELFKHLKLKEMPENYQNATNEVLDTLDRYMLPHIGLTPEFRQEKMEFLAQSIRKTILVHLGAIPQTDRDSYRIKRIHAAGDNTAKTLKSLFNQMVVQPVRKQMSKIFNSTPFSQVNLAQIVRNATAVDDFERVLVQTIVLGNKATLQIRSKVMPNRLQAQLIHRKNDLNTKATMRQVSSTSADSARQSERAMDMRRVHMSAIGYICPCHTPTEGAKVGVNKQMAMFASIAPPSSSEVLKKILMEDPAVLKRANRSPLEIYRGNYASIYINGYLIGYTLDSMALVRKYRAMRRAGDTINMYTTIFWDNVLNEVLFFVDIGRMVRPLVIVYNTTNGLKSTGGKFRQGIAVTSADIQMLYSKKKTIYDLVAEQKVEFITPEEQQNCLLCPSLRHLQTEEHNEFLAYTHCDIPQAILGLTAITAPFGNHNQTTRVIYQTSQGKQTGGFYTGNWPHRIDKEAFLQYISETPLIRTLANKYTFPNGNNLMVAIMCYTGANQEDSTIVNQASVDRGVFNGCKFDFEQTELEQKEELGQPDITKCEGIKAANYGKLVNGVVQPGTMIVENDVLIAKYMHVAKAPNTTSTFIDRSIVYRDSEPAIIQNVIVSKNEDGNRIVKVSYRKIRPLEVGDKMSSRSGQKGIAAMLMTEADMPFTTSGICPDIIFNPHGIPTRMTCSQLIESLLGNICAIRGAHYDGTIFKAVDFESFSEALVQYGFNKYGNERMISGITGEFIDTEIFFGPVFYQRLLKFVLDSEYAVKNAMTDAITHQPLDGMASNGGLRIGEMERDTLSSHGSSMFLREKFFNHSDGYTVYLCRCGSHAIVNVAAGEYKCKKCGDLADIVAVKTSWTSKLFMQEMISCNIGVRQFIKPYNFSSHDVDNKLRFFESYSAETFMKLKSEVEDAIEDTAVIDTE
jgi:DNA-directed RNA polymerase beta subunit